MTFNKGTGSIYMDTRIRGGYGAVDCLIERQPWLGYIIKVDWRYDLLASIFFWWGHSRIGRFFYEMFSEDK